MNEETRTLIANAAANAREAYETLVAAMAPGASVHDTLCAAGYQLKSALRYAATADGRTFVKIPKQDHAE